MPKNQRNVGALDRVNGNRYKYVYRRDWYDDDGKRHLIRSGRLDIRKFDNMADMMRAGESDWERKRRDKEESIRRDLPPSLTAKRDNDLLMNLILEYALKNKSRNNNERRPRTIAYNIDNAGRLRELLGDIQVKDFTVEHAKNIRGKLDTTANKGKPYAQQHVPRIMRLIRDTLHWAITSKPSKIKRNVLSDSELSPEERVELFNESRRISPVHLTKISSAVEFNRYERFEMKRIVADLTEQEYEKLSGAARRHNWNTRYLKLMCRLMYETGLRVSEVCGLRWADIRFGHQESNHLTEVYVRHQSQNKILTDPKSSHSQRVVPVGNWAIHDALNLHKVDWYEDAKKHGDVRAWIDNDLIFPVADGSSRTKEYINRFLHRRCKALDISYRPSHAFRRGFATEKLAQGMDPHKLCELLGHKPNTDLWAIYADMHSSEYRQAINAEVLATAIQG